MIKVTIEKIARETKTIAEVEIINNRTGTELLGNYDVTLVSDDLPDREVNTVIEKHPRQLNVLYLILKAVTKALSQLESISGDSVKF